MSHLATLAARVIEGKIVPDDPGRWAAVLARLPKRVQIAFERYGDTRTEKQNGYYWKVVNRAFLDYWSQVRRYPSGLPPYTKDEVHDILVQAILGSEDGPLPGTRERKTTHDLKTWGFRKFTDDARELALHAYGMHIPEPPEQAFVRVAK